MIEPPKYSRRSMGGHEQIAALAIVIVACIAAYRSQGPEPLGPDAPSDAFSAARASSLLQKLLPDDTAHPAGTTANVELRERLVAEIPKALGLPVSVEVQRRLRCQRTQCAVVHNVLAHVPPSSDVSASAPATEKTQREGAGRVMLTAHYDSVGAGPGASDDIAGIVTALEAARALIASGSPRPHGLFLAFTDAEELGLLGARALSDGAHLNDVIAVLNFEARGTAGPSFLFETGPDNRGMIERFQRFSDRPATHSAYAAIYHLLPNDTDFSVYRDRGLSGGNFGYIRGIDRYHTPHDRFANLNTRSLQHHGDNALAMLRGLMDSPDAPIIASPNSTANADVTGSSGATPNDAVYADILQATLWVTDAATVTWAMVALLLGWFTILVVGVRRRWWRWWQPLAATGTFVLGLCLAGAIGFGLDRLIAAWSGHMLPWWEGMFANLVAMWGATMAWVLATRRVEARYLGGLASWMGTWLAFTIGALVLALYAPGFSPLLALPALVAFIGALVAGRFPAVGWAIAGAGLVIVWLPISAAMADAMGTSMGATATVPAWLLLAPLAAGRVPARGAWMWPAIGAVAAAGFAVFQAASGTSQIALLAVQQGEAQHAEVAATIVSWRGAPIGSVPTPLETVLSQKPQVTPDWTPSWFLATHATRAEVVPIKGPEVSYLRAQEPGDQTAGSTILVRPTRAPGRLAVRLEGSRFYALREPGGAWMPMVGPLLGIHGVSRKGVEIRLWDFDLHPDRRTKVHVAELHETFPETLKSLVDARDRVGTTMHTGDTLLVTTTLELPR